MSGPERLVSKEESAAEVAKLHQKLSKLKDRDMRGIQTLFRTTSYNHYTLNHMVDRKANIMITVNSIILSVLIGGYFRFDQLNPIMWPIIIMAVCSLFSITPNRTQGRFTQEDVRLKKGNLLYFGNFHKMVFEDYEWGMLQKLNDSDYLYRSMIKDLYYLGKVLGYKYKFIRISLFTFLSGLVASSLLTIFTILAAE